MVEILPKILKLLPIIAEFLLFSNSGYLFGLNYINLPYRIIVSSLNLSILTNSSAKSNRPFYFPTLQSSYSLFNYIGYLTLSFLSFFTRSLQLLENLNSPYNYLV